MKAFVNSKIVFIHLLSWHVAGLSPEYTAVNKHNKFLGSVHRGWQLCSTACFQHSLQADGF